MLISEGLLSVNNFLYPETKQGLTCSPEHAEICGRAGQGTQQGEIKIDMQHFALLYHVLIFLILLHSERPKLHTILAFLSAIGLIFSQLLESQVRASQGHY